MSGVPGELLDRASRCLLAVDGPDGPLLAPMAFWFDGAGLWMLTSRSPVEAAVLRRAPACVVYVSPLQEGASAMVVRGRVRVFGPGDPLGLLLHAPTISAAMTALAARDVGSVVGYVQDAVRVPPRWSPGRRAVLRLAVEELEDIDPPAVGPGVAPALPTVVPPGVRRALAGCRRVAVAFRDGDALEVTPAVWSGGYELTTPPDVRIPEGAPAVAAVDAAPHAAHGAEVAVHGQVRAGPRLQPEQATWWDGVTVTTAPVPAPTPGGIDLPD